MFPSALRSFAVLGAAAVLLVPNIITPAFARSAQQQLQRSRSSIVSSAPSFSSRRVSEVSQVSAGGFDLSGFGFFAQDVGMFDPMQEQAMDMDVRGPEGRQLAQQLDIGFREQWQDSAIMTELYQESPSRMGTILIKTTGSCLCSLFMLYCTTCPHELRQFGQ